MSHTIDIFSSYATPSPCPYTWHDQMHSLTSDLQNAGSHPLLVTDANVWSAWSHAFTWLNPDRVLVLPNGEHHKTLSTVTDVTTWLATHHADRTTPLMALGGGVITDLVGFAASIYQRGMPLVLVPTSLLAMIDAAIGGKTGVDAPWGKNQLGTFYWPTHVHLCPQFLSTLPHVELTHGLAEMLKHGIIADQSHFESLEALLLSQPSSTWPDVAPLIQDSLRIKLAIVKKDAQEQGTHRLLLNLGHTFAHAIEHHSHYAVPHGLAVAMGLVHAAQFGHHLGLTPPAVASRIQRAAQALIYTPATHHLSDLWPLMLSDKKKQQNTLQFILPQSIGSAKIVPVSTSTMPEFFEKHT